jgi:hypothetical protein
MSTTSCYIKDAELAWIPAVLEKTEGDKAYVKVPQYPNEQSIMNDGGRASKGSPVDKVISLKDYPHNVLPLANVDQNGNLTEHADMVKLPYLHEVGTTWSTCERHERLFGSRQLTRTLLLSQSNAPM